MGGGRVVRIADHRDGAIRRQRDRRPEAGPRRNRTRSGQDLVVRCELRPLPRPGRACADERPHGAARLAVLVEGRPDQRLVTVRRQRHRRPELSARRRDRVQRGRGQLPCRDQFRALLEPPGARPAERPGGPRRAAVRGRADENRRPVAGDRDARAERAVATLAGSSQLLDLMPHGAGALEDPRRAAAGAVAGRAGDDHAAVGRDRDACAELTGTELTGGREDVGIGRRAGRCGREQDNAENGGDKRDPAPHNFANSGTALKLRSWTSTARERAHTQEPLELSVRRRPHAAKAPGSRAHRLGIVSPCHGDDICSNVYNPSDAMRSVRSVAFRLRICL